MKRADLIRHLAAHGCQFVREGGKHTVYRNAATGASWDVTSLPDHRMWSCSRLF